MAIYSDFMITERPLLFISGQTPQKDNDIPEEIEEQLEVVIEKIDNLVTKNKLLPRNIVKMNVYLTNSAYLGAFRIALSKFLGEHKPAMTVVIVSGLVNSSFKVEIDATVEMNHS